MINSFYKLEEVPINSIKPSGWLLDFLKTQASGLTGNLEQSGYPFDCMGWDKFEINEKEDDTEDAWWPYEQTAYWIDGMEKCGEFIGDKKLIKKAEKSFEYAVNNADKDGYIGPFFMKNVNGWNRWPHVVFFRALIVKYLATNNKKYLDAICDFYLKTPVDYSNKRDVMNVEIMVFAYLQTGNKKLLELAEKTYKDYNEKCDDDNCVKAQMSNKKAYAHGVTYNEFSKLGAILYGATGKKEYLIPTLKAYKKIDRYQMLVDGCPCSNEFMIDNKYYQSHETCVVTDYTWAIGYVLMATGDGIWADKIERCIFNAGIGSVTEDFRALQYFSCPNQIVLDSKSNHNIFHCGEKWMSYRPNPGTECCPGNVNRFLPNYCAKMWMKKKNSVFATLYGASSFEFDDVLITEKTDYPFEDEIRFTINTKTPKKFCFNVRIPFWCDNPVISVNGEKIKINNNKGFCAIEKEFCDGDSIVAVFESKVKILDYNKDGIYVEKGPLIYCYGMYGDRQIDKEEERSSNEFPAYNIYPEKDFNYTISKDCKYVFIDSKNRKGNLWDIRSTPISIKISAKKINGWKLTKRRKIKVIDNLYDRPYNYIVKKGNFTFTPRFPTKKIIDKYGILSEEKIKLVPMATAKLRITIFPKIKVKTDE